MSAVLTRPPEAAAAVEPSLPDRLRSGGTRTTPDAGRQVALPWPARRTGRLEIPRRAAVPGAVGIRPDVPGQPVHPGVPAAAARSLAAGVKLVETGQLQKPPAGKPDALRLRVRDRRGVRRGAGAADRLVRLAELVPEPAAGAVPQHGHAGPAAGVHAAAGHRRGIEDHHRGLRGVLPGPAEHHRRRPDRGSAADPGRKVAGAEQLPALPEGDPALGGPHDLHRASGWPAPRPSWC